MTIIETPKSERHAARRSLDEEPAKKDGRRGEEQQDELKKDGKKELPPWKRLALALAVVTVPLIVVWALRPFDRIVDYVLPPSPSTELVGIQKVSNDSVFSYHLFQNRNKFPFRHCSSNATLCCNGLENTCDLRINQVMFATVHNAVASKEDGSLLNPSQYLSLESALEAGYRGIHLEVCKCNGVYEFCHGVCRLGARNPIEVFINVDRYLRDNRQEVLLLNLHLNSAAHEEVDLLEFYQVVKNSTRFVHNLYSREKDKDTWPTLGRMIGDDRRVLLFHSQGPNCVNVTCPAGMYYGPHYWRETTVKNVRDSSNIADSCSMRHEAEKEKEAKHSHLFHALNHFASMPDHDLSEKLNEFYVISRRLASCERNHSTSTAVINSLAVDFWSTGDVVEFVQKHNKARIAST